MNPKRRISKWKLAAWAAVIACGVAALARNRQPAPSPMQAEVPMQRPTTSPPQTSPVAIEQPPQPGSLKETPIQRAPNQNEASKEQLNDPAARGALTLAGASPKAE